MQELILDAARKLIDSEGISGFSIRRIGAMIEYSPAIIYHYFKNKEEIIEKLLESDYSKVIESLAPIICSGPPNREMLTESARNYIRLCLKMGDTYRGVMMNSAAVFLEKTAILHRCAADECRNLELMRGALRQLPSFSGRDELSLELTAQVVWVAAYGLIVRLGVEQVDEAQQNRLIEEMANFLCNALGLTEPVCPA